MNIGSSKLIGLPVLRDFSLGLVLGCCVLPNQAAQSNSSFDVAVTLPAASPGTALCRSENGVGAFGATVTVVCATGFVTNLDLTAKGLPGLPVHGGAYRFLTRVSSDEMSGTVDSYAGAGTSTAFRLVSTAGREYVEMTVGW